jgi:hypothetical protein
MRGHTDKNTINQRKPPTPGMIDLLRRMARRRGGRISQGGTIADAGLGQADQNAMRGLLNRGMADWDVATRTYGMTAAGREAIGLPGDLGGGLAESADDQNAPNL